MRKPPKPSIKNELERALEDSKIEVLQTNLAGDRIRTAHTEMGLKVNALVDELLRRYPGLEEPLTSVLEGTAARLGSQRRARERAEREERQRSRREE